MGDLREIVCTVCPKGCQAQVWVEKGEIQVEGEICKRGIPYVEQEYQDPRRILTTTVMTQSHRLKRLPVRTSAPIPTGDLFKAMALLSRVTVAPPVKIGEIILADVSSGIDVVASDDLLE